MLKSQMRLKPRHVYLISSGDLRLSANQKCWPEQAKMEAALAKALKAEGWTVVRAHALDKQKQHGFIDSQKMGMEVFRKLDPNAPLIVAEASGNTAITCWPACPPIAAPFSPSPTGAAPGRAWWAC